MIAVVRKSKRVNIQKSLKAERENSLYLKGFFRYAESIEKCVGEENDFVTHSKLKMESSDKRLK